MFLGEVLDQRRQGHVRVGGQRLGHDAQGQGPPSGESHQPPGHGLLTEQPVPAETAQERQGVLGAERVEPQQMRPVADGQAAQALSAGAEHTGGAARNQRAQLVGAEHVVEHDEDALTVEQTAVQRRTAGRVRGDACVVHPEAAQHLEQGLGSAQRTAFHARTAQVDVELPVRKVLRQPVGEFEREGTLAHSGRTVDDDDRGGGPPPVVLGEQPCQVRQLPGASDEPPGHRRELGGPWRFGQHHGGRDRFRGGRPAARGGAPRAGGPARGDPAAGQDLLVQRAQFGTGVDAELVPQQPPGLGVDLQGVCLAAAEVQRGHQQPA